MHSINFHVARSVSPPHKAREVHKALDMPLGLPFFSSKVHQKWRKKTHTIEMAIFIGWTINRAEGVNDALQHLLDDLQYNQLIYGFKAGKKKGGNVEEQGSTDAQVIEQVGRAKNILKGVKKL